MELKIGSNAAVVSIHSSIHSSKCKIFHLAIYNKYFTLFLYIIFLSGLLVPEARQLGYSIISDLCVRFAHFDTFRTYSIGL